MIRQQPLAFLAVVCATVVLILVVVDATLVLGNQKIETDVQSRQQLISKNAQYSQIANVLVQALSTAAVNSNDTAIRALLAEYGVNPAPSGTSTPKSP